MAIARFEKDPDAKLDFVIDWADWLATGDTISASTWTVPSGITKESDTHGDDTATIWISGGTARTDYTLTNKVTTAAGRIDERSIIIRVRNR